MEHTKEIKTDDKKPVNILIEGDKITITKSEINPIMAAAGAWKGIKETGEEYQKRVRSEWKKREKRLIQMKCIRFSYILSADSAKRLR